MSWLQSEQRQQLALGKGDELSLSRQEMGEQNLQLLQEVLSKAIRGMKVDGSSEKSVKLMFQGRGGVECFVRASCHVDPHARGETKYVVHTSIFEKGKRDPFGRRTYAISIYPTEVKITSDMQVVFGYEGHRLGTALISVTDEVVERFLSIAKREVDGKTVEMEMTNVSYAEDSHQLNRENWTQVQAESIGFDRGTGDVGRFFVKRYR